MSPFFGDYLKLKQSKLEIIEQRHGGYLASRHWHIAGRDRYNVILERDDGKLSLSVPLHRAVEGNFGRLL